MWKQVTFRVQAWKRRDGDLVQAGHHVLRDEAMARALAVAVSKSADGVAVMRLEGEPVFDLWREPVILARYGSVPDLH